jgi:hypothetical protein
VRTLQSVLGIQTPRIPRFSDANELRSAAGFGAKFSGANRCLSSEAKWRMADLKGVRNGIYLFFFCCKVRAAHPTLLIGSTRYYLWIKCFSL